MQAASPLDEWTAYLECFNWLAVVVCFRSIGASISKVYSPQLDQVQESARPQNTKTIGERFMVKEESAASVDSRPWTPEGRGLTLSVAFML
ncbi:hypothetical protein AVEN_167417-1 [Araneus ventricosus]|uniref:Uncharacterized protein n=1 Tax=Araneus ventricosus TaxID=182803 RepID=A0A4Y2K7D9_ARAVE|nr:hypothetical protein AVEN_167417-1 [Araneus ventricosus]